MSVYLYNPTSLTHDTDTNVYIERARAIEAARAAAGGREGGERERGRLYGLPLLIKDMTPVAGLRFVRG